MSDSREKRVEDQLDLSALEERMQKTHESLEGWVEKMNGEIETAGNASAETKSAVEELSKTCIEIGDRLAELEQKSAEDFVAGEEHKSIGDMVVESEEFKALVQRASGSARMNIKTAIVNATPSMTQPLVPGDRLDTVVKEPDRALRIRDLLPAGRTNSNIVWFPKEDTFTNNADVVRNTSVSPIVAAENVTKPESALTFTSDSEAVVTIAHFIPVSTQAMDDSPFLASYLNSRLIYGYRLKEEDQLLNGTGVTGYVTGINTGATAYAQADSPESYSTNLDFIRDAKRQAEQSNYMPTAVVLNPKDWSDIELQKDTQGRYIVGNPLAGIGNTLWGLRVVASNSQTAGTFTVLDPQVCQIFDRENLGVQVSYEDSTNFQKNMVTVRAEGRLAFCIYNTGGIIKGTFA